MYAHIIENDSKLDLPANRRLILFSEMAWLAQDPTPSCSRHFLRLQVRQDLRSLTHGISEEKMINMWN